MAYDYKKEYKEFYMPKNKPSIVDVPAMNYIAVRGKGNPNEANSEYKQSIGLLYAIAFTIKMSKKEMDFSKVEFMHYEEGLCVQMMHTGAYDDEPASIAWMDEYVRENGYMNDISDKRMHHEIYLSDARRVAPEKLKTVIRHPIRKS